MVAYNPSTGEVEMVVSGVRGCGSGVGGVGVGWGVSDILFGFLPSSHPAWDT